MDQSLVATKHAPTDSAVRSLGRQPVVCWLPRHEETVAWPRRASSWQWSLSVLFVLTLLVAGGGRAEAAALLVDSLLDDGTDCTLRDAITAANTNSDGNGCVATGIYGDDTITFSVSGIIRLSSTLPAIEMGVGTLTIDGGQTITISGDTDNNGTGDVQVMAVSTGATLTLQNLTIDKGRTLNAGDGAILNSGGILTVLNSTFSGNSAQFGSGGIFNNGSGMLTVTNSTFSGNSTPAGNGGGISNGGTLNVTNSTFSGNSAGGGGGIRNSTGTTTLRNTIIANSPSGGNCSGTITDEGGNLQFPGTTCGATILEANPLLDPAGLQDNGGPTQTIALCTALNTPTVGCTGPSPALDTGDNDICDDPVGSPDFGAGELISGA